MSELSKRSGVATATIKFYLRERLLDPGALTSPNQASYGDAHLARLTLIRALLDVGGLSVPGARAVLAAIDDDGMPLDWTFGVAQRAIPRGLSVDEGDGSSAGDDAIDAVIRRAGLAVSEENPGRAMAGRVLDRFESVGHPELLEVVPAYLRAALIVAEADLDVVAEGETRARMAETVVVGTVLGDSLLFGLRRIAQEHVSHARNPVPVGTVTDQENC